MGLSAREPASPVRAWFLVFSQLRGFLVFFGFGFLVLVGFLQVVVLA